MFNVVDIGPACVWDEDPLHQYGGGARRLDGGSDPI